jgi:hypothetical protein
MVIRITAGVPNLQSTELGTNRRTGAVSKYRRKQVLEGFGVFYHITARREKTIPWT